MAVDPARGWVCPVWMADNKDTTTVLYILNPGASEAKAHVRWHDWHGPVVRSDDETIEARSLVVVHAPVSEPDQGLKTGWTGIASTQPVSPWGYISIAEIATGGYAQYMLDFGRWELAVDELHPLPM
jgi:hypothetical protein